MLGAIRRRFLAISDRDVMLILLAFFAGAIVGSCLSHVHLEGGPDWASWWDSVLQNFGTEMFGAFLTFLLIEVLVGGRRAREAEERETEALKKRLIRELGSGSRDVAVPAVEELRAHGWLGDGSLEGADLYKANLQGVDLSQANLQRAHLREANLKRAKLWRANLQEAVLWEAKLQGAELIGAELQEAVLVGAELQGADLSWAKLQGANLTGAILGGANLQGAEFNEKTTLPDPDAKWTPDTDMRRFTGPEHPDFWRSDDPKSPAYRGKEEE